MVTMKEPVLVFESESRLGARRSLLQLLILSALKDDAAPTIVSLAERLKRKRPSISRSLKTLKAEGLVVRAKNGWCLTDVGMHEVADAEVRLRESVRETTSAYKKSLDAIQIAGMSESFLAGVAALQQTAQHIFSAPQVSVIQQTAAEFSRLAEPYSALTQAVEAVSASWIRDIGDVAADAQLAVNGGSLLQPLTDALAGYQQALGQFGKQELARICETLRTDVLPNMTSALAGIDLKALSTQAFSVSGDVARRMKVRDAFLSAYLFPSPSMDCAFVDAVLQAHEGEAESEEIRHLVMEYYDADACAALAQLVDRLCANTEMAGREQVLKDALAAHRMGLDTITTHPLVAMIEGIIVPALSDLTGVKIKHNDIDYVLTEMPISLSRGVGFEAVACVIAYMEAELYDSFDWEADAERRENYVNLNRHALLHGMATQGTRMNTLRCFLILDILVMLLPELKARASLRIERPWPNLVMEERKRRSQQRKARAVTP